MGMQRWHAPVNEIGRELELTKMVDHHVVGVNYKYLRHVDFMTALPLAC